MSNPINQQSVESPSNSENEVTFISHSRPVIMDKGSANVQKGTGNTGKGAKPSTIALPVMDSLLQQNLWAENSGRPSHIQPIRGQIEIRTLTGTLHLRGLVFCESINTSMGQIARYQHNGEIGSFQQEHVCYVPAGINPHHAFQVAPSSGLLSTATGHVTPVSQQAPGVPSFSVVQSAPVGPQVSATLSSGIIPSLPSFQHPPEVQTPKHVGVLPSSSSSRKAPSSRDIQSPRASPYAMTRLPEGIQRASETPKSSPKPRTRDSRLSSGTDNPVVDKRVKTEPKEFKPIEMTEQIKSQFTSNKLDPNQYYVVTMRKDGINSACIGKYGDFASFFWDIKPDGKFYGPYRRPKQPLLASTVFVMDKKAYREFYENLSPGQKPDPGAKPQLPPISVQPAPVQNDGQTDPAQSSDDQPPATSGPEANGQQDGTLEPTGIPGLNLGLNNDPSSLESDQRKLKNLLDQFETPMHYVAEVQAHTNINLTQVLSDSHWEILQNESNMGTTEAYEKCEPRMMGSRFVGETMCTVYNQAKTLPYGEYHDAQKEVIEFLILHQIGVLTERKKIKDTADTIKRYFKAVKNNTMTVMDAAMGIVELEDFMEYGNEQMIQDALKMFHREYSFEARKFQNLRPYINRRFIITAVKQAQILPENVEKATKRMWTLINWCSENNQTSYKIADRDRIEYLRHESEETDEAFMVELLQLKKFERKVTTYQSGGSAPSNMSHQDVEKVERAPPKKRTSKKK